MGRRHIHWLKPGDVVRYLGGDDTCDEAGLVPGDVGTVTRINSFPAYVYIRFFRDPAYPVASWPQHLEKVDA